MTKFKTLDDWEREQIDKYIQSGGHVTKITPAQFYDEIEEKAKAGKERARKRSTEMHRRKKLGLSEFRRQQPMKGVVIK